MPFLLLCNIVSELKELYVYVIFLWIPAHFFLKLGFGYLLWLEEGNRTFICLIFMLHSLCPSMHSVGTQIPTYTQSLNMLCLKSIKWFHYIKGRHWNMGQNIVSVKEITIFIYLSSVSVINLYVANKFIYYDYSRDLI